MKPVVIEQSDVNSESARLVEWTVADGAAVATGQIVCVAETTKAVIDVPAPAAGKIFHSAIAGTQIAFNTPVAFIAESPTEETAALALARATPAAAEPTIKASKKARQLAAQHGLDLAPLAAQFGLVTEKDVYAALGLTPTAIGIEAAAPGFSPTLAAAPSAAASSAARVLVLGAGLGAMQVIDILLHDSAQRPVGCLDDDTSTHGTALFGVPVWGALAALDAAWSEKRFDRAIVSISTNVAVRKNLFDRCRALGIPLANALDPTVRLNRGAGLGTGNVLCSFVHLGVAAVLGDNNFISSHTSIEHHNTWGSHNTVGPACATSSRVRVGDEVVFGTGVFIQPGVGIGSRARIASGAVLTQNIPADHAVKMHADFRVVPLKPS